MKKWLSLCVVLVLGMTGVVQATPLARLIGGGGSITVNDKIFDSFTLFNVDGDVGDLALIDVSPIYSVENPGLRFTANNQLSTFGYYAELEFGYRVRTVDGAPLIHDNSLEMQQYTFLGFDDGDIGGVISIYETVYDADVNYLGEKLVVADRLFNFYSLYDHIEFPQQNWLWVYNDIGVYSDFPSDYVSLDVFDQRFSQTPEPATMFLLGTGLVGVASVSRRKKKNRA